MTSNIIYLSSGDEGEDVQIVSTKRVRYQESPKITGAVSSTDVNRDAVTEPQKDLSAPVVSIPEQRAPMLGPKPKSFDLGGSKQRSGLAMVRAASAPHGEPSATTVSGLHRVANFRAAPSLKVTKLPLAFASPTRDTPSKAIDRPADPVKHFRNGTPGANEILAVTPAADSVSPQVVTSVSLTDPFVSSKTANNATNKSAVSRNAFFNRPSKRGATSTANTLNEPLVKRQKVEAQPVISRHAPYIPKPQNRNRFLWSIPAYNSANDPTRQTAPTTEPAAVRTNAPPRAQGPAFSRRFESARDKRNAVPNAADDAPGAPHLPAITMAPPPRTSTAFAPAAAPPRPKYKPWTSREYAEMAQVAYHSFPFAPFAASHNKTEADVMRTFSAIIQLPTLSHSAKGLAKSRMRDLETAEEETREVLRAEERRGGGYGAERARVLGVRAEDEIRLMRG